MFEENSPPCAGFAAPVSAPVPATAVGRAVRLRAVANRVRLLREQRRDPHGLRGVATRRRTGHRQACSARDLVETRDDLLERLSLIDDLELEKRRLLHDILRALGVVDAGQLDDDALVAGLLHDRFGHPELVDALTHDLERAIEGIGLVGHGLLGFIDFERQVHAALQVESTLERHAPDGVIHEDAVALHALDDGSRKQGPHGNREEPQNEQEAVLQVRHRCRWPEVDEKRTANCDRSHIGSARSMPSLIT